MQINQGLFCINESYRLNNNTLMDLINCKRIYVLFMNYF